MLDDRAAGVDFVAQTVVDEMLEYMPALMTPENGPEVNSPGRMNLGWFRGLVVLTLGIVCKSHIVRRTDYSRFPYPDYTRPRIPANYT